jgi:RNA polymerase sigma-70 factor, ECF subfamily
VRREASPLERTGTDRTSDVRELGTGVQRRSPRGTNVVLPLAFHGDDPALVAAIKDGHAAAKAALFQRYSGFVERVITHVLGPDRELSDILQDVFLNALSSIHLLKDPLLLRPWLYQVATLTARKVLRKRSRRKWLRLFVDTDEESRWEIENARSDASTESRSALRAVYAVLERLPADERIAFALRYMEGLELTEVAGAAGVSLATAKRRVRRAELRFAKAASHHPELRDWLAGGARWANP